MVSLDEVIQSASGLEPEERASLAVQLIHSLERPGYHVSDEEVAERVREGEADPSVMIGLEELKEKVRGGRGSIS